MAAVKFYALLPGPHGRAASTNGYWDQEELAKVDEDSFAGYPLVPAHFFGPQYSTPQTPGTGGYNRNGLQPTVTPVVDLS
jgi:hypothetical protein